MSFKETREPCWSSSAIHVTEIPLYHVNHPNPQREPRNKEPHVSQPGLFNTNPFKMLQRIRRSKSYMLVKSPSFFSGVLPTPNLTALLF